MKRIRYNFLFVIGLVLVFGAGANTLGQTKANKNLGILTVKTSPQSYPVKVDGQVIGMSGVVNEAVFYLEPGEHVIEVEGPNGANFKKTIFFEKGKKHCVCLKVNEETTTRKCPYDVYVEGPERYVKGDTLYFKALNKVTAENVPINYKWSIFPATAQIIDGLNTDTITVSTKDLNGEQIRVNLDVTDDIYGATCKQKSNSKTEPEPDVEPKDPFRCDTYKWGTDDDAKARLDGCVIALRNNPDAQLYLIFYQGTSRRQALVETKLRMTRKYLISNLGVDPSRIAAVQGGTRPETTVEIWIVPPGARTPVPTPY